MKLQINTSLTRLIIVGELILVTYLFYTLTVSVYKSYQLDQVIKEYERENAKIEADNKKKTEDYDYFTSDNYIEKIAKQNLGIVRPGEEVIVLSQLDNDNKNGSRSGDGKDLGQVSNAQIWWSFFFDTSG